MPDISPQVRADLTAAQADAALDMHREVLCLACAGSGKSRTLAYRIAYLLADGCPAPAIAAITFTEKAAESIKRRVADVLVRTGQSANLIGQMYIGTIHGFCQSILGDANAVYRQYDVLDGNRLLLFLMSRFGQLEIAPLRVRFNGRYFETLHAVVAAWNISRDEGIPLVDVAGRDPEVGACLAAVQRALEQNQFLDFASMVRLVADGAANNQRIAERLARIRHLLVDEYQDVSGAQEELVRAIHAHAETIFVVGDDDQSIYGWRGAHVANILTFTQRYPGAHQHILEMNYRSTRAIVESSNAFAAQELGAMRLPKQPVAHADRAPRQFGTYFFATRPDEADWVASRIRLLLGTEYQEREGPPRGLTLGDFAILMRSTKTSEQDGAPRHAAFTQALAAMGLRYTLAAGGSVFDRDQVSALRYIFSLLAGGNPDRAASLRVFTDSVGPAYPGADQAAYLRVLADWGRRIHAPVGGVRQRLFPQALLVDLLDALNLARSFPADDVMRDIGLFSRMLQDVESVYLSVDSAPRFGSVANFLNNVAEGGYDVSTEDVGAQPDAVVVSTVHQCKGLEYPVVFVADVEPRRFPRARSNYDGLIPQELIDDALRNGAYLGTTEAEARLFYTGLTRAERYLYVTGSASLPGARRPNRRSQFMLRLADREQSVQATDIPAGLVAAPGRARVDETTLPTSFSDVRYYLRCPMDYRFRKGFGFSPPVPELFGYGRVVHVAIEKLHELFSNAAPTVQDARRVVRENFHLKHVSPSRDPINRPGAYERAEQKAEQVAEAYVGAYQRDFTRWRQVEARFEIPAQGCLITGAIDLIMRTDDNDQVVEAEVLDFKTMEGGDDPARNPDLEWTELSLQVQLYARAAREVLGENAAAGSIHLLKDNQRIAVPIEQAAVDAAMQNIEWAVSGIFRQEFPMRPAVAKCRRCDFNRLCPQREQPLPVGIPIPPAIHTPAGGKTSFGRPQR